MRVRDFDAQGMSKMLGRFQSFVCDANNLFSSHSRFFSFRSFHFPRRLRGDLEFSNLVGIAGM